MNTLQTELQKIFQKIIAEVFDKEFLLEQIVIKVPPKKEIGDYTFYAFSLAKELKLSPNDIVARIYNYLNENKNQTFEDISVDGNFLNFRLSKSFVSDFFIKNSSGLTEIQPFSGETVIVDYTGINLGKPLHIGHLCPCLQGQFVLNLYKKLGSDAIGDTHIGDWGIIFGKLITAYKMYGDEEKLKFQPVEHLFELYVKITSEAEKDSTLDQKFRDEFKKLSLGDKDSIKLWTEFKKYSLESIMIQFERLGIEVDYNIGESFYEGLNLPKLGDYPDLKRNMNDIVEELIEKGIATKNEDGSVGIEFPENTKLPSCMLQKRDGTHGYLASDLACIKYRMHNWKPSKMIYSVDLRQQLHFKQVFETSKMAGRISNNGKETELTHAYFGFISLTTGPISTRKGNIIRLKDVLDEAETRAKKIILEKRQDFTEEELDNLSKIIGIGAIKYGYLSKNRTIDSVFDWDEFMTFEGNSGPYIQYTFVRAKQILKNGNFDTHNLPNLSDFEYDEEIDLAKELFEYKNILLESANSYQAYLICNYVYNLTKKFNTFYNKIHILSEKNDGKRNLKLLLVYRFTQILEDAFSILGIKMPDKM